MSSSGIFLDARYIDSPERAHFAIRRAAWFSLLHAIVASLLAGFVLVNGGRSIAGFDHKVVINAAFLCFAAFRLAKGSEFWLYLLVGYETLYGVFCFVSFRYADEFIPNLVSMGVVIVAWLVYAGGMRGAEYLRSHASR
jgi:hypothetical protein